MFTCRAPGCATRTAGYSHYCRRHKAHRRRHGEALQLAIRSSYLKPYLAIVQDLRKRNPASAVWTALEARWQAIVDAAEATVARVEEGNAYHRPTYEAARAIQTVAKEAEASAVIDQAVAIYLLRDQRPATFISDRSFMFELVRRVRHLAPSHSSTYWDNDSQRVRKVYRDMIPKAVAIMAEDLHDAVGPVAAVVARKVTRDHDRQVEEQKRLADAVEELLV